MRRKALSVALYILVWRGIAAASDTPLRVTFLGTGAPRPSLERYGPSILVEADDERFLVDAGWGLRERLFQVQAFELFVGLQNVFLTHLHYDHTIGLADLWLTGWLYGRRMPLRVHGPPGTASMMEHLEKAFQWDIDYRTKVGVPAAGARIEAKEIPSGVVFERNGLKITAFEVGHMPIDLSTRELLDFDGATYGYRVDYQGRSVVFSGDTRPSDELVRHARGADVLVHEVQVPSLQETAEAKLANVSLSVHSEPEQVARIFARVRPRLAVYSHIIPPDVSPEGLLAATHALYDGPVEVARDLMMIAIGDEDIEISDRERRGERIFERSRVLR